MLCGFTVPAHRAITLPGMVRIVDNFYVDQTEVNNISWREYQYWLQQQYGATGEPYLASFPDSTSWNAEMHKKMRPFYYTHPAFDNYPVVGISHQQAQAFCRWRSLAAKARLQTSSPQQQWLQLKDLEFRLPTRTEWELIARLNRDKARVPANKAKFPGKKLFNVKPAGTTSPEAQYYPVGQLNDFTTLTSIVNAYPPGELGIYNLYGNVAEMIAAPDTAMGGGYIHTEREVLSEPYFTYSRPADWLGFRCVCDIRSAD